MIAVLLLVLICTSAIQAEAPGKRGSGFPAGRSGAPGKRAVDIVLDWQPAHHIFKRSAPFLTSFPAAGPGGASGK
ncbi:hypothetical protein PRIPAC_90192 [Pristionchus pacificus]|uniref:Uncharacterized protein n=1 Tax=Pristionchus pacificus TaxID=54126 RepID=A0A2A6B7Y0_PRIPA|nr:hypothetical protein PRIPAC_90192 [Pristionchus pacificus]|eukprot:PDM61967.1 hypothetical protein PRIPAC_51409 [Pristionchus pacificus]